MIENSGAVVYVTDSGFIYPTLVSAVQLAEAARLAASDVLIFLIDISADVLDDLTSEFRSFGFAFLHLNSSELVLPPGVEFADGHVPVASLWRLALYPHIPRQYDRLVYIDGDTQITGDVSSLLTMDVPIGKIAAGRGGLWLTAPEQGPGSRADKRYLDGLGISADEYFNAGVLALRRETLKVIGPMALAYFFENSAKCRQHDQSALNYVCKGNVIDLWPGFNFHAGYQGNRISLGDEGPAIVHFTGPFKPWLTSTGPFSSFAGTYDAFDRRYPLAARLRQRLAPERTLELSRKWRQGVLRSRLTFWRPILRRWRFSAYLKGQFATTRRMPRRHPAPQRTANV